MTTLFGWPGFLALIALPFVLALGAAVGREVRTWQDRRQRRALYEARLIRRLREVKR